MIVAGFVLHLYCSCAACRRGRPKFGEYGEPTKALAFRTARKAGWRLEPKSGRCWAPGHTKRVDDYDK